MDTEHKPLTARCTGGPNRAGEAGGERERKEEEECKSVPGLQLRVPLQFSVPHRQGILFSSIGNL